jgi:dipeptidyl aminopeptidase/acylaminoacyl peptidase
MQADYGSWTSPITSDLIVAEMIGVSGPRSQGSSQYWLESRPQEAGRNVIVQRLSNGETREVTPTPFNVRTRVHEYGGAAWWMHAQRIYFVNFDDQQIYSLLTTDDGSEVTAAPQKLTDADNLRFANGIMDTHQQRIICVVEDHSQAGQEPQNYLGAVAIATGTVTALHQGHDFYAAPALSPNGEQLAWITWDHPAMPWDGTQLWQASATDPAGATAITGGSQESVQQPRYDGDGNLHYISDRSGWWNLYRQNEDSSTCLWPMDAEFGVPQWAFGSCTYQFQPEGIVCLYSSHGESYLARLNIDGSHHVISQPCTQISSFYIDAHTSTCLLAGASPTQFNAIIALDFESGVTKTIKSSCDLTLDPGYYAVPQAITYPTADDDVAHGFYYPPTNKDFEPPAGSAPPLIVELHGGPTSATHSGLSLSKQYWTSRGFAVLDVNYRGSTGYGRAYREKLRHQWGVADVDDTVYGARYLVEQRLADPAQLAIKGGSAGGYTTLAALALRDTFKAGASYYGIGDLEALARDTHKFESRYLDSMIGQYPKEIAVYKARSPINHIDKLSCPVIFFQGLEDKVVLPNQAEQMVEALSRKGIPVAYVPFEGEQHGFRKSENIKRALDLELYFYGKVFGFTPADVITPIDIINLKSSTSNHQPDPMKQD